uniref:Cytochrome P450 family 26 subfamily C member 1 n=1 Tax=Malurus cyaneus samueli TaxID=2593467 RepID=A0A8C5X607_9PASS
MVLFLRAASLALLVPALLVVLCRPWALRWSLSRDRASALPLPKGSMGWPFFGETLHWLLQGSRFHSSRRERYGNVFKTHLLGRPVVRVTGAENIRKILLGEHTLVSAQWPQSTHIILGSHTLLSSIGDLHRQRRKVIFSRTALESYLPRIQKVVSWELRGWCMEPGSIAVYSSAKTLTFRIAARILLGLRLEEKQFKELAKTFEQLVENLFSLPLNIPFSGLRKGIKARDMLHKFMEKAIQEKLQRNNPEDHSDALDFIMNSAKEHGKEFTMQELKVRRSSSLQLLGSVAQGQVSPSNLYGSHLGWGEKELQSRWAVCWGCLQAPSAHPPVAQVCNTPLLPLFSSPQGYQIPKGWSVMYSIRDTHETAAVYQTSPSSFDPDRFNAGRPEAAGRFHYIPFGGGARSCIGKELAQAILKLLAIELVSTARWELATPGYPSMQTVPIVHPVDDGLQLYFHPLQPSHGREA